MFCRIVRFCPRSLTPSLSRKSNVSIPFGVLRPNKCKKSLVFHSFESRTKNKFCHSLNFSRCLLQFLSVLFAFKQFKYLIWSEEKSNGQKNEKSANKNNNNIEKEQQHNWIQFSLTCLQWLTFLGFSFSPFAGTRVSICKCPNFSGRQGSCAIISRWTKIWLNNQEK